MREKIDDDHIKLHVTIYNFSVIRTGAIAKFTFVSK